ncbi:MAG: PHP domain-containing protein [Halanaerobiaceae bacterium]
MKKLYNCDLHIHSCLSPCADILMTPGNIIKKAVEVGLDIIAITDHNSAGNIEAALKIAKNTDLILIPGIEVASSEEVHLLCFFSAPEPLLDFEDILQKAMPDIENDEENFGYQILTDENDEFIAKEEKLLAVASDLSVEEIVNCVNDLGGIVIPSHVDRPYNSILGQLGFIPPNLEIAGIEISKNTNPEQFFQKYPYMNDYFYIVSSDSHYLNDIKSWTKIDIGDNNLLAGMIRSIIDLDY